MTNSAAGSSDLQKNKSSSSKKKMTVTNDAMKDHNEGKETLNMGLQTGTNSGDIEVGQLPATRTKNKRRQEATKAETKPRWEADKKHYDKKKAKLEDYDKMANDFGELKKESENSRKDNEWMHRLMQEQTKLIEELRSRVSSLTGNNESLLKQTDFLSFLLSGVYKEKDEWKRKYEFLVTLMTPQQLWSMCQDHPAAISQQQHVGMNQHVPVAISQQQQHVDIIQQCTADMNQQPSVGITQPRLVDDFDHDIYYNRLLNTPSPPQLMQTGGGESEMQN